MVPDSVMDSLPRFSVDAVPAAIGNLNAVVTGGDLRFAVDPRLDAVGFPADHEQFAVPEFYIQVSLGGQVYRQVFDAHWYLADHGPASLGHEFDESAATRLRPPVLAKVQFLGAHPGRPRGKQEQTGQSDQPSQRDNLQK